MNQNVRRAKAKQVCSQCGKEKIDNGKNWYKNSVCAACYQRKYKLENPDAIRDAKLRCVYGFSLDEYRKLLSKQDGKCAICRTHENKTKSGKVQNFVVDHDHKTEIVRGLLCHTCNMRVGIYENWGSLLKVYLRKL